MKRRAGAGNKMDNMHVLDSSVIQTISGVWFPIQLFNVTINEPLKWDYSMSSCNQINFPYSLISNTLRSFLFPAYMYDYYFVEKGVTIILFLKNQEQKHIPFTKPFNIVYFKLFCWLRVFQVNILDNILLDAGLLM